MAKIWYVAEAIQDLNGFYETIVYPPVSDFFLTEEEAQAEYERLKALGRSVAGSCALLHFSVESRPLRS